VLATTPMLLTCQPSVRGSQPFFTATAPDGGPALTPQACQDTTWCSNHKPYNRNVSVSNVFGWAKRASNAA